MATARMSLPKGQEHRVLGTQTPEGREDAGDSGEPWIYSRSVHGASQNVHDNLLFDTSFTELLERRTGSGFLSWIHTLPWTWGLMMERTGIRSNMPISFPVIKPNQGEDSRIERRSMRNWMRLRRCGRYTRNDISLSDALRGRIVIGSWSFGMRRCRVRLWDFGIWRIR